jgi:hypothetical protein
VTIANGVAGIHRDEDTSGGAKILGLKADGSSSHLIAMNDHWPVVAPKLASLRPQRHRAIF